jgi:hypothetical protein
MRCSRATAGVALATSLFLCGCESHFDAADSTQQLNVSATYCATDLSCQFGRECINGSCTPIAPGLRPHIQAASILLRPPIDDGEIQWRAQHYDVLIGGIHADKTRAANPKARMFEYSMIRYHRFGADADAWALAHGYNPEDFYLHYKVDTDVPTWEGTVIVPGFPPGRVPGWNPGGPNASATSRNQARVVGYNFHGGVPWYFANVGHPGYKAFLNYFTRSMIDGTWYNNQPWASGPLEGLEIDESIWYPAFGEGLMSRTTEYYGITVNDEHPYTYEIEATFPRLAEEMLSAFGSTKDILPNYGHVMYLNYNNRCAKNVQLTTPWNLGEVWVTYTGLPTPTSGGNRCITYDKDYVNGVREIVKQTHLGGRRVLGARDTSNGTSGTSRGKLFTLALYYLVQNKHTYFEYKSVGHSDNHVSTWLYNPAIEYNVGQPATIPAEAVDFEGKTNTTEHWLFATGQDPYAPALTYRVLARRYTNALVLVKMLPLGSVEDNRSITTHQLTAGYRQLQADGTLGGLITVATLRNNEALILIPEVPTGVGD